MTEPMPPTEQTDDDRPVCMADTDHDRDLCYITVLDDLQLVLCLDCMALAIQQQLGYKLVNQIRSWRQMAEVQRIRHAAERGDPHALALLGREAPPQNNATGDENE